MAFDRELKRRYVGGTTLLMFDRSPDRLVVAHVGDSRAALDDKLLTARALAALLARPTAYEARDALRGLLHCDPQIENATALLLDVSP